MRKPTLMDIYLGLCILVLGCAQVAITLVLCAFDMADAKREQRSYCQEVAVWMAEEARGIAPLDRTGHPDYRGKAAEVCPGLRPAP